MDAIRAVVYLLSSVLVVCSIEYMLDGSFIFGFQIHRLLAWGPPPPIKNSK